MGLTVRFGPVYSGPACGDHECGIEIRIHGYAAGCAGKGRAVTDTQIEAAMAGLGGVGRVDLLDPDTLHRRLVFHEVLELSVGPIRHLPVPMGIPDLRPPPDAFQVFHPDERALVLHCLKHDLLRQVMVHPGDVAELPSGEPFQGAFSAFRAFGLERRSNTSTSGSVLGKSVSRLKDAGRRSSDIPDAQIDTKDAPRGSILDIALDRDVDPVTGLGFDQGSRLCQVGSPEGLMLVGTDIQGCGDPFYVGGEGHDTLSQLESEGTGIQADEGWFELKAALEVGSLKCSGRTAQGGDGQVGRQAMLKADFVVKIVVKPEGIGLVLLFSKGSYLSASPGVLMEEGFHDGPIRVENFNRAADGPDALHSCKYKLDLCQDVTHKTEAALILGLKAGVSAPSIG